MPPQDRPGVSRVTRHTCHNLHLCHITVMRTAHTIPLKDTNLYTINILSSHKNKMSSLASFLSFPCFVDVVDVATRPVPRLHSADL